VTVLRLADGGLGDTLDVVAQDLAVALGTTLSETLAALAAWRGCQYVDRVEVELRRVEDELSGVGTHVQSC
jgi:hypothetical protein